MALPTDSSLIPIPTPPDANAPASSAQSPTNAAPNTNLIQTTAPNAPAGPASTSIAGTPASSLASSTSTAPVNAAPTVGGVTSNETVQGQLDSILGKDSTILQNARARAQQVAAGRGLQNSSIAAQAGEEAVINTAMPIAQQDATTTAARQSANLLAQNQFGLGAQDLANKTALVGTHTAAQSTLLAQESTQRLTEMAANYSSQERLQGLQQSFQSIQAALDRGQQITLADKNFQNQQALMVAEYGQKVGLSQLDQQQQLERMNAQHENVLSEIQAQVSATKAASVVPQLQSQYLAAISNRQNAGSQEIASIFQTQGLTSAQQNAAVANAYQRTQTDLIAIGSYYKQSPNWDPAFVTPSAPAPPVNTPIGNPGPRIGPGGGGK